jgi:hypothetical protein
VCRPSYLSQFRFNIGPLGLLGGVSALAQDYIAETRCAENKLWNSAWLGHCRWRPGIVLYGDLWLAKPRQPIAKRDSARVGSETQPQKQETEILSHRLDSILNGLLLPVLPRLERY